MRSLTIWQENYIGFLRLRGDASFNPPRPRLPAWPNLLKLASDSGCLADVAEREPDAALEAAGHEALRQVLPGEERQQRGRRGAEAQRRRRRRRQSGLHRRLRG